MSEYVAANRANWNDRVAIHVASEFYDVAGWLERRPGMRERERDALGDVTGLDVVHLQCHFGLDTLALADSGARVTGVDFSPDAVREARRLAERAGLSGRARFIEADVLHAAEALLPDTFDVVYVSLGALCWLPSVAQWASQVAALLRPGGRLYLHDSHPLSWALDDEEPRLTYTYFEEAEPFVDDSPTTYTDGDARIASTRSYEWNHSLGEIVGALLDRGMRLLRLEEHDWTVHPRFPWLVETAPGLWGCAPGRPRMPLTFTILARRDVD